MREISENQGLFSDSNLHRSCKGHAKTVSFKMYSSSFGLILGILHQQKQANKKGSTFDGHRGKVLLQTASALLPLVTSTEGEKLRRDGILHESYGVPTTAGQLHHILQTRDLDRLLYNRSNLALAQLAISATRSSHSLMQQKQHKKIRTHLKSINNSLNSSIQHDAR